jgi:hypothetical protein
VSSPVVTCHVIQKKINKLQGRMEELNSITVIRNLHKCDTRKKISYGKFGKRIIKKKENKNRVKDLVLRRDKERRY